MRTIQIAPTAAGDVTDETLKLGPPRLLTFLQGVSDPAIRALFAPLGWSDQRLDEAWSLLNELKAANKIPSTPVPDPVTEGIASCEAWQATGLIRARAMMQLAFPEQAAFMFHDFVAGTGTEAVLNVATFLQRRQELDNGVERKGTRKADHDALQIIEETGVTKEMLKKLQGFVDNVQTVAAPIHPQHLADADAKRTEVLRKIHAWITAWSEMARTVITRRDQMIKLGIAKRRSHKAKGAVTPPAPPVTPAPPVVVAPAAPALPPAAMPIQEEVAPESRAA
jgi:hypothetical protein